MNKKNGYNGNENLKKVNTNIQYTDEQTKEIIKCAKDPIYFIKNYIKIVNVDRGIIPFELWKFQEDMIKTIVKNRFSVHKLSRQIGKCGHGDTKVKIRNKKTGKEEYILLETLFNDIK